MQLASFCTTVSSTTYATPGAKVNSGSTRVFAVLCRVVKSLDRCSAPSKRRHLKSRVGGSALQLDATAVPEKAVNGTPWYQVVSNFNYEDQFNYIGAHISEREKLIEDGYNDEYVSKKKGAEMTQLCKRTRWEQSDMVMICMNLSYIPDDVARKINFRPGW